eukprot:1792949-Prymnesium_polylepis.1
MRLLHDAGTGLCHDPSPCTRDRSAPPPPALPSRCPSLLCGKSARRVLHIWQASISSSSAPR